MPLFTVRCTGCGIEREALLKANARSAGFHFKSGEMGVAPRSVDPAELDAAWHGAAPSEEVMSEVCGTWFRVDRMERPWSPPSGRYSYGGS